MEEDGGPGVCNSKEGMEWSQQDLQVADAPQTLVSVSVSVLSTGWTTVFIRK